MSIHVIIIKCLNWTRYLFHPAEKKPICMFCCLEMQKLHHLKKHSTPAFVHVCNNYSKFDLHRRKLRRRKKKGEENTTGNFTLPILLWPWNQVMITETRLKVFNVHCLRVISEKKPRLLTAFATCTNHDTDSHEFSFELGTKKKKKSDD